MVKAIRIVSLLAVLSLVLLAIPLSQAKVSAWAPTLTDVWVAPPPIGDDTNNDGSEAHPFATIKHGLENVVDNGTVHVAAGIYNESLHISDAKNLIGAGAHVTTINGVSSHVLEISSGPQPNTISGFTIQNGLATSSLWNPADEQILYAGIKLPSIKILQQLFNMVPQGGGIYISGGHIVTLNDCVIKDNQATDGGGIYSDGDLYMYGCTVSGNSATQYGGGIYNRGTLYMCNCTLSGNTASLGGGGIYNDMSADIMSQYSTIASNQATDAWSLGGGFNNVGTFTFANTIVANNTAGDAAHNNGYNVTAQGGTTVSLGYNLDSENSCEFDQPTDLVNTDPLLGPLQDNGGPTFTHALLHGSPAIDAGICAGFAKSDHVLAAVVVAPGTDQRGVPRPQGANCDIGAYELAQGAVNTSTKTGIASFSTLNGYITSLTALSEAELDCPPMPDLAFPNGLFSFTVTGITPGSSVTVVIILPSNAPIGTQYWKCINGKWVDCTSLLGSNNGDSVLTLTITDGGLGDRDEQVNGEVSDPGGPVIVAPSTTASGVSPTPPRPLNPSQLSIQYVSVNPHQTTAGQPVTITTNVVNTGDEAGNMSVALKINGMVEQTRMVSVGPQGTQPVKFTISKDQPGTYTVDIFGEQGSFTVLGDDSTAGAPVNGGLIALLIMGALILATVLVLLLARKPA
jgi:predicted outer membrane repeat protein